MLRAHSGSAYCEFEDADAADAKELPFSLRSIVSYSFPPDCIGLESTAKSYVLMEVRSARFSGNELTLACVGAFGMRFVLVGDFATRAFAVRGSILLAMAPQYTYSDFIYVQPRGLFRRTHISDVPARNVALVEDSVVDIGVTVGR